MKETADSQAEAKREEEGEENIVNPIALALCTVLNLNLRFPFFLCENKTAVAFA